MLGQNVLRESHGVAFQRWSMEHFLQCTTVMFVSISLIAQNARADPPSFDCRTGHSTIEALICSDPELSRLDVEMNNTYGKALKRAGLRNSAAIRDDQRDYNRASDEGAGYILNDASPDSTDEASNYGNNTHPYYGRRAAIAALKVRMEERIRDLRNIEPDRRGFAGHWRTQSGTLDIVKTAAGLKVSAHTNKFGWTRYWCRAEGLGHLKGATLVVDAKGVNGEALQLHLTREGAGLKSEYPNDGGRFCPGHGELETTIHFIPVRNEAKAPSSE